MDAHTLAPAEAGGAVQGPPERRQRAKRGQGRAKGSKEAAAGKLVHSLQANGGRAPAGSVRRLGRAIGESKSTVHNALAGLIAAGVVERVAGELVLRG